MRFVVQKHEASHLHYDFRLEHKGVLLSWAIPKRPAMAKGSKRLAIRVDDHDVGYIHFAGTIPKGQYGAGRVSIWDRGTYEVRKSSVASELKAGHLHLTLHGKRLHGDFDLVRFRKEGQKICGYSSKQGRKHKRPWLLGLL